MLTKDTLFSNNLLCYQHQKGYRFSIDSILLAHFVRSKNSFRTLDLGTGCGVINLVLHYRYKTVIEEASGLEIQQGLCDLANKNYKSNNLERLGTIFNDDVRNIRTVVRAESYDIITCNPPFYKEGTGRKNPNEEERIARHQVEGDLNDFLGGSFYCLKNRGTGYFIYPAQQVTEFIEAAGRNRLEVKRLRFVYGYPGSDESSLVLIECKKNGQPGVRIMSPLYVYERKNGDYSEEVRNYFAEQNH